MWSSSHHFLIFFTSAKILIRTCSVSCVDVSMCRCVALGRSDVWLVRCVDGVKGSLCVCAVCRGVSSSAQLEPSSVLYPLTITLRAVLARLSSEQAGLEQNGRAPK